MEPVLEQFKPAFISRIYFKDFTFGGAPIELDNVWVDQKTRDKVVMEVDIRWSAETANIALAVDMLGSSDLTRLVVRVQDVALSGTARITFQPLIDEYPGFGAMTVALMGVYLGRVANVLPTSPQASRCCGTSPTLASSVAVSPPRPCRSGLMASFASS